MLSLNELIKRGFYRDDDDGAGGGGGGEGGGVGDPPAGNQFSDEMMDALVERIATRLPALAAPAAASAAAAPTAEEANQNEFLDNFASQIERKMLDKMSPMLRSMANMDVKGSLKNIPPEILPIIEKTFSEIPGAALADMMEKGGHTLLAQAAIGQALLQGKITGFTAPTTEGSGGAGAGVTISEDMQREMKAYEAITGKAPTIEQLKEWGNAR